VRYNAFVGMWANIVRVTTLHSVRHTTLTAEEHDNHGVMTTQCKQEEVVFAGFGHCWIYTAFSCSFRLRM